MTRRNNKLKVCLEKSKLYFHKKVIQMWKYKQYEFNTKLEMESFVRGYIAAITENIKIIETEQTQETLKPIDYPVECGIEAILIFDEL